jgi:hypothetical protein
MNLLDVLWYFIAVALSAFSELKIHFIVFGDIFPAFLIACLTHSNFALIFPKVLTLEKTIRTTK